MRVTLSRAIAVAIAIHSIAPSEILAQLHVVGIDANGALVHNRQRHKGEIIVQVADLKPPKTIAITNNAGFDVKVYEYNPGDPVMAIARKGTTLKNKATMTISNNGSHIKVFRPALLDEYLTMHRNARTDLTIVKSGTSAKISAAARRSLTIANRAQEQLKICVYDEHDLIQAIPKHVVFVKPGVTAQVNTELGERFRVSVFWPRVLDERGWSEVVKHRSQLTVSTGNWSGWQKIASADSGGGITELAVDSESNASGQEKGGGAVRWKAPQYYVYGLGQDGKLWMIAMEVEEGKGGTPAKFRWANWNSLGLKDQMYSGLSVVSVSHDLGDTDASNQEVFSLDQSGQLIRRRLSHHLPLSRAQEAWTRHGGKFAARPSAVAMGGRFDRQVTVYAIDPADKTLRELNWDFAAQKWNTKWTNLGGALVDAPWAVATNHGHAPVGGAPKLRVDVFARGTDNQLWHRAWLEGIGWKAWESLGGNITSSPAALEDGTAIDRGLLGIGEHKPIIRVFARGAGGDYQMITWDGDKWGKWESLGGNFRSAPIAFCYSEESLRC
jgi:hypothetical protein